MPWGRVSVHRETKTSWSEEVGGASGAERAFSATLALLLGRIENRGADYARVAPSEAAAFFAELSRFGNTRPGSPLGDGVPGYSLYAARDDWISVPEQYFWERLLLEFGLEEASREDFEKVLMQKTAEEWTTRAAESGLPVVALRDPPPAQPRTTTRPTKQTTSKEE